jgi:hypothetical protein
MCENTMEALPTISVDAKGITKVAREIFGERLPTAKKSQQDSTYHTMNFKESISSRPCTAVRDQQHVLFMRRVSKFVTKNETPKHPYCSKTSQKVLHQKEKRLQEAEKVKRETANADSNAAFYILNKEYNWQAFEGTPGRADPVPTAPTIVDGKSFRRNAIDSLRKSAIAQEQNMRARSSVATAGLRKGSKKRSMIPKSMSGRRSSVVPIPETYDDSEQQFREVLNKSETMSKETENLNNESSTKGGPTAVENTLAKDSLLANDQSEKAGDAAALEVKRFITCLRKPQRERVPVDYYVIYKYMRRMVAFHSVDSQRLRKLCDTVEYAHVKQDANIFEEGDVGSDALLLL